MNHEPPTVNPMPTSIDTRTLQPGDTYVAICGELHDGHAFVPQAVAKGAVRVVVEQDVDVPASVEVVRVASTLDHLTAEASARVRASGARVVAITGSVGKTSTRAAVVAVLREAFAVVASEGNFNTPLGLSLTILNREIAPEAVLVLEMGARLPGDIRDLCALFPPAVSVVTNVKGVHVETLGSIDGVAREKSEIVRALGPDGTACLHGDDPRTRAMASLHAGRSLLFGRGDTCDVRPERITATLPILGAHAVDAALAAFAVGVALGMDDDAINLGLAAIAPEKGRLARLRGVGESVLIDDTYNASPDATLAALDVLAGLDAARRVAFLGDMLELGATETDEHTRVLTAAVRVADAVHAVGPIMARAAATLAPEAAARVTLHATSADAAAALRAGDIAAPTAGDASLVKGSQGTRMERVAEALLHPDVLAASVLARQTDAWKAI